MQDEPGRPDADEGFGGWVLTVADAAAITSDLKTYGQVFRVSVADGPNTRALAAGQPCFLFVEEPGNEAVKPGIWAVGEVVAEVTERADGSLVAEVELLPLQERLREADLVEHEVLGTGALLNRSADRQPQPLSRAEVRSLEEWDFDFRPPSPEQEANLALTLAEVDAELDELYGD